MGSLSKVIVTIIMIIGFFLIFGAIIIQKEQTGNSGYIAIAAIVFFGLVAGIKAVWKKKKDSDNHNLDKRN